MTRIPPNHPQLSYSGRIDFADPAAPTLVWALSSVSLRFTGTALAATLRNHRQYWGNYMGVVVDGRQSAVKLPTDDSAATFALAEGLPPGEHTATLFKRQDACHYVDFLGFAVDGEILPPPEPPSLRVEFFGDSVTCGEVSEADDFVGKEDPPHDGEFSNAWYSYAHLTARALGAEAHITAQGGVALMDGAGYFRQPNTVGMENIWDKTRYNPQLGAATPWGFAWAPHVVCVAVGQNDKHPDDYMRRDPGGEQARAWKTRYRLFVSRLRAQYPQALIILKTTILNHDDSWDAAIADVCAEIGDTRIVGFRYSNNACGTPGHIRRAEAAQMAAELAAFIRAQLAL